MTDQSSTSVALSGRHILSFPSRALDFHTSLFDTLIDQETEKVAAFYRAKLTLVETQLKTAQNEAESLRQGNTDLDQPQSELQKQLEATQDQLKVRDVETERLRKQTALLVSVLRKSAAKFTALQQESKQRLLVVFKAKQTVQTELDTLRAEHTSEVQKLTREKEEAEAERYTVKQEAAALKALVTLRDKSLLEAKSTETTLKLFVKNLRKRIAELEMELGSLKHSSRVEQDRSSEEMKKAKMDFETRLEVAVREGAEHRAKAQEASAQYQSSSAHVRLLVQELERAQRESSSTITTLQRQMEGASLASNQELTHVQEELSSLRAEHSRSTHDAENALAESTRKNRQFEHELSKMQEDLSRADAARRAAELECERAKEEVLYAKGELDSGKTRARVAENEYNVSLRHMAISLALLRKELMRSQASTERQSNLNASDLEPLGLKDQRMESPRGESLGNVPAATTVDGSHLQNSILSPETNENASIGAEGSSSISSRKRGRPRKAPALETSATDSSLVELLAGTSANVKRKSKRLRVSEDDASVSQSSPDHQSSQSWTAPPPRVQSVPDLRKKTRTTTFRPSGLKLKPKRSTAESNGESISKPNAEGVIMTRAGRVVHLTEAVKAGRTQRKKS